MKARLTTVDNPYNPFTQIDEWEQFDLLNHNTYSLLARIAKTSDSMTDEENEKEVDRAMDEIVLFDPQKIYMKVTEDYYANK